jgi:hypothetical protein
MGRKEKNLSLPHRAHHKKRRKHPAATPHHRSGLIGDHRQVKEGTGRMKLGDPPMAQFKEATLIGGDKIIVNMDQIRVMHWIPDTTTIRFDNHHGIQITETPNDLMMRKALRNMDT